MSVQNEKKPPQTKKRNRPKKQKEVNFWDTGWGTATKVVGYTALFASGIGGVAYAFGAFDDNKPQARH
jgi:hypothetical protein